MPQAAGFSGAVKYTMPGSGITTITVSGQVLRPSPPLLCCCLTPSGARGGLQVGMDGEGNIPEDVGAQAEIALASIASTLEAAGASMADVIKMNTCMHSCCPC